MPSSRLYDAPVGQTVTQCRVGAVHARHRKVDRLAGGILADFVMPHAVEPHARRICAERLVVGERPTDRRRSVPLLARGGAGVAADAGIQIDDEPAALILGFLPLAILATRVVVAQDARGPHSASSRRSSSSRHRLEHSARSPSRPVAHCVTLTRRSNHAAWPVTGSELVRRRSSLPPGNSSEIR